MIFRWTSFSASKPRHLALGSCLLWLILSWSMPMAAQTIRAVQEGGRTVFTNDSATVAERPSLKPAARQVAPAAVKSVVHTTPPPQQTKERLPAPAKAQQLAKVQPAAIRELVYWSNTEQRWKPVPSAPPKELQRAQSAAADVAKLVQHQARSAKAPERRVVESRSPAIESAPANEVVRQPVRYLRTAASSAGPRDVESIIVDAAARHQVDPNLVRALIKVESNFNPSAVSNKGAMGLMQLMPATARRFNVSNPFNPQQNVDAGVQLLRRLIDNFGGDVKLALAAYNAGEGAVTRSGGIPAYAETRDYVRRVHGLWGGQGMLMSVAPIRISRNGFGVLTISNVD